MLKVCLVGSTSQEADWREYTSLLTQKGYIVFEAGSYDKNVSKEIWDIVGEVHWGKIDLSDIVAVIPKPDEAPLGYHTNKDINYALSKGKVVKFVTTLLNGSK